VTVGCCQHVGILERDARAPRRIAVVREQPDEGVEKLGDVIGHRLLGPGLVERLVGGGVEPAHQDLIAPFGQQAHHPGKVGVLRDRFDTRRHVGFGGHHR